MALYDDHLKKKISELPSSPGVYQYFDSSGVIIYIGKAKNLKNRVLSYLNQSNQSNKTRILVNKITDLRYIVVNSEQDALLLENNLIKKYKPRYNILFKDDKAYPWIAENRKNPLIYAFIKGFSCRGNNNGGLGFRIVKKHLHTYGGEVQIRSGNTMLRYFGKTEKFNIVKFKYPIIGTQTLFILN